MGGAVRGRERTRWLLVLAEHLAKHGGEVDQPELGRALSRESSRERTRPASWTAPPPVGAGPRRWWGGSGRAAPRGSFGGPTAISTIPVGLVPHLDLATVAHRARRAAAVCHCDPLTLELAAAEAVAVAVVARVEAGAAVDADDLITQIVPHVRAPQLHSALRRVPPLVRLAASPSRLAMQLNAHSSGVAAVAAGLAGFLSQPEHPPAAIRFALRANRQPATAAALAGALCGAHGGERELSPGLVAAPRLRRAVEAFDASLAAHPGPLDPLEPSAPVGTRR